VKTTGGRAESAGCAASDRVQPFANSGAVADYGRPPDQHQEHRLEGVFGIGRISQDRAADGEDHRPMPAHQCRERGLVLRCEEAREQFSVGPVVRRECERYQCGATLPSSCSTVMCFESFEDRIGVLGTGCSGGCSRSSRARTGLLMIA
jgi:hypothetical protein